MKNKLLSYLGFFSLLVLLTTGCGNQSQSSLNQNENNKPIKDLPGPIVFQGEDDTEEYIENVTTTETVQTDNNYLYVHYLNVGQAHATLIQSDDFNMLIDSGNYADGEDVVNYIKDMGIESLDIVIGTHPHEDHIGCMDVIFDNIDVDEYYCPSIPEQYEVTANFYKYVKESILNNNITVIHPTTKDIIYKDDDTTVQILYDGNLGTDNYNEYSICTKITFEDTAFIISGDAEELEEKYILDNFSKEELSADVILAGHHGSYSSNSYNYLSTINPKYAIISCAAENAYGHPHKETLDKFDLLNIKYYITATDGTIIAESDGKSINIITGITGEIPLGDRNYEGIIKYPDSMNR